MANTDTIGTSLQFPIQLLNGGGETVSGDDNIHQSIFTLLGVDEPTFFAAELNSKLKRLQFEPNDDVLKSLLTVYIKDTLKTFEKRIKVISIKNEVDNEGSTINCAITFEIIREKRIDTFVYPFYKQLVK